MALPTSTFTTYSAIGNREDLSDVIYRSDVRHHHCARAPASFDRLRAVPRPRSSSSLNAPAERGPGIP